MSVSTPPSPVEWDDPIVGELHELRAQLLEKYYGDIHAYSDAARARALALGFQLTTIKAPETRGSTTLPSSTSALA